MTVPSISTNYATEACSRNLGFPVESGIAIVILNSMITGRTFQAMPGKRG
jgi:hypothetical protein